MKTIFDYLASSLVRFISAEMEQCIWFVLGGLCLFIFCWWFLQSLGRWFYRSYPTSPPFCMKIAAILALSLVGFHFTKYVGYGVQDFALDWLNHELEQQEVEEQWANTITDSLSGAFEEMDNNELKAQDYLRQATAKQRALILEAFKKEHPAMATSLSSLSAQDLSSTADLSEIVQTLKSKPTRATMHGAVLKGLHNASSWMTLRSLVDTYWPRYLLLWCGISFASLSAIYIGWDAQRMCKPIF